MVTIRNPQMVRDQKKLGTTDENARNSAGSDEKSVVIGEFYQGFSPEGLDSTVVAAILHFAAYL